MADTLAARAVDVLMAADPADKQALSAAAVAAWRGGALAVGHATPPDRPGRPARPELKAPRDMPRRRAAQTLAGRVALLHALAHIELNAIDLAWDIVARFTYESLPRSFYDDWVTVADEEARHFGLLRERLAELGTAYGDLPAHGGLWQAAEATADDLAARLAVVPLVLEARGLDVTPAMIERLTAAGDEASVHVLEIIYRDEIGHVAIGRRWFEFICARQGREPETAYHSHVQDRFKGLIKPPFNTAARDAAGLTVGYYEPLVER